MQGTTNGNLIRNSITSKCVLHYFSQPLSVQDGRESMSRETSPSLPENCWKGDLKRCSVNSATGIYMLGVFCASCSWMHRVSFPSESQWAQRTIEGVFSPDDLQRSSLNHYVIVLTFVVIGSWEMYLKWNFLCFGFFCVFKDSCAWTLLASI